MAELNLKRIEEHYARMSDDELERIVTTSAHGLRPEVFPIIEHEIKKRNLNPDLFKGALAQNKEYTIEEIESYSHLLSVLPCPKCGNTNEKLNGTISYTVISYLIFSSFRREPFIACPDCLNKINNNAIISTALLGWWGFPWGFLKTPVYIYRNFKAKSQNRIDRPNDTMLSFTLAKVGEIEAFKDNQQKLKEIIQPKRM